MTFKKGESGNPGGKTNVRNKLSDSFLRCLYRDWQEHGERVVERVRREDPVAYFRGLLTLLPKDVNLKADVTAGLIDAIRNSYQPEHQPSDSALAQETPEVRH